MGKMSELYIKQMEEDQDQDRYLDEAYYYNLWNSDRMRSNKDQKETEKDPADKQVDLITKQLNFKL
tara:strand:- start:15133 stop:15330 length:198 start_codon:yes stop_codon:yes gene_type:complete